MGKKILAVLVGMVFWWGLAWTVGFCAMLEGATSPTSQLLYNIYQLYNISLAFAGGVMVVHEVRKHNITMSDMLGTIRKIYR